jgi:hypothetical protein
MMKNWYEDEKKVIELAEFLVRSVEIVGVDELLEYFKHPDRYTEVWNIYEKEILGKAPIFPDFSKKLKSHEPKRMVQTTDVESCACGVS